MKSLGSVIAPAVWVAGIVLAKGFWPTTFAVIIPFYSWYLVIAKLLHVGGLV